MKRGWHCMGSWGVGGGRGVRLRSAPPAQGGLGARLRQRLLTIQAAGGSRLLSLHHRLLGHGHQPLVAQLDLQGEVRNGKK